MDMRNETRIRLDKVYTPRDYQRDIFDAIENMGYKKAVLCWPRRCLHHSTKILMYDYSEKTLDKIKVGDKILSFNGKKFESDTVENLWVTEEKPTLRFNTAKSRTIVTSEEHLFLTSEKTWVKACELEAGSSIATIDKGRKVFSTTRITKVTPQEDMPLMDMETRKNHNFIANTLIVHNSGKDVTLWHLFLRQALKRRGVYLYCLPTYRQARDVIWDSIRTDGLRIRDMIPNELVLKCNESKLSIELCNGSIIRLIGSNTYNKSIRGNNALGIVLSEFAQADPGCLAASLPIIQANDGFIIIQSTPWGYNKFYDICSIAEGNPKEWFYQHLDTDRTKHISKEEIEVSIRQGVISREFANQEYNCRFDTGAQGAYYANYLIKMRLEDRIGDVPHESHYATYTAWDLGYDDSTFIIFFQIMANGVIHIIDELEDSKKGLEHYIGEVLSKDYIYQGHLVPHDSKIHELGTGLTRIEQAERMGLEFTVVPLARVIDGIETVRCTLGKIYIDEKKCTKLIRAIANYAQEFDSVRGVYKNEPRHDMYSHAADALRYLCSGYGLLGYESSAQEIKERFVKVKMQEFKGHY